MAKAEDDQGPVGFYTQGYTQVDVMLYLAKALEKIRYCAGFGVAGEAVAP